MKKEYMKPDMRVVEIKHRCRLLDASPKGPGSYNNQSLSMPKGSPIEDENDVY